MSLPKRLCQLALTVAVLAAFHPLRADDTLEGIDAYMGDAMSKWQVPALSIAAVKDNKVVLVRGYGVRDVERVESVDGHTVFRLASISKTFTAASVGLVVDEGTLKWDDPAKKHLPAFELADSYLAQNVTFRDLLCHRVRLESGEIVDRRGDLTSDAILGRLKYLQPYSPFCGRFKNSNLMYVAAGEAVARASGQSWEGFVTRRLIQPLGMRSTAPTFARLGGQNRATPYRLHAGIGSSQPSPPRRSHSPGFFHRAGPCVLSSIWLAGPRTRLPRSALRLNRGIPGLFRHAGNL